MCKRSDIELINHLVKTRKLSAAKGQYWLSLPLVTIPPMPTDADGNFDHSQPRSDWQEFYYQHRDADPLDVLEAELACPLFDEFVIMLFKDYYVHIRLDKSLVWGINQITIVDKTEDGFFTLVPADDSGVLRINAYNDKPFKCSASDTMPSSTGDGRTIGEVATGLAVRFICSTLLFFQYNHQADRYAVEVRPAKRGLAFSKKSTLTSKQGPSIIYLDKFPTRYEAGEPSTEGGHKRAHPRRGHYKTLRADRYRDHPKYGVENGIYVKPAWIGDKSTIIEGNIYTVRG